MHHKAQHKLLIFLLGLIALGCFFLIGLGLNWNQPSEDSFGPGLGDQYTAEIFYRFRLLKTLSITPDVQVLFNSALNPDEDVIFVFGLRGRISF